MEIFIVALVCRTQIICASFYFSSLTNDLSLPDALMSSTDVSSTFIFKNKLYIYY